MKQVPIALAAICLVSIGPRILSQVLEGIDLCIAERKAQQEVFAAFLRKH